MPTSFRQARWFRKGRTATPRLIVVHCTVSREMGTGAEAVASYFATVTRKASTHLIADSDTVVRCVQDEDTCYGAGGVNHDGLHVELVGMPDQTLAQWLDPFGRAMFATVAPEIRAWMTRYGIPARWLTVAELQDGRTKGFCTHADAEKAFPSTGHWDPGPHFPKGEFLAAITGTSPYPQEVDVIGKDQLDDRKAAARQMFRLLNPPRNPANQAELDKVVWSIATKGYEATVQDFMDRNGAGVLGR